MNTTTTWSYPLGRLRHSFFFLFNLDTIRKKKVSGCSWPGKSTQHRAKSFFIKEMKKTPRVYIDSQDFKLWMEVRFSFCSFFTGLFANSPLTRSQSSHNGSNCSSESLWVPRNKKTTFTKTTSSCLTYNVRYFSQEIIIFLSVKIVSFLFINQLINGQLQTDNYNHQIRYFIFWCLRRPSRLTNSGPANARNCILESKSDRSL